MVVYHPLAKGLSYPPFASINEDPLSPTPLEPPPPPGFVMSFSIEKPAKPLGLAGDDYRASILLLERRARRVFSMRSPTK